MLTVELNDDYARREKRWEEGSFSAFLSNIINRQLVNFRQKHTTKTFRIDQIVKNFFKK